MRQERCSCCSCRRSSRCTSFPAVGVGSLVQDGTGTLLVLMAVGQVVVVYPLPDVGEAAVQVATGTLVVLFGVQVVAV